MLTKLGKTMMALSTVASLGVAFASISTAHAATTSYKYYSTVIQENGSTISQPGHIATKDPFGGSNGAVTSFLPIWYIDQAMGKFGVTVNWDGVSGVLNLTTPNGMVVKYPSAPNPVALNNTTMRIEINGQPVTYAPRISYYDEGSGGITTTFVPVYYLEKAIGYMGIQTGWNGTDWTMKYTAPTQTTPTTSSSDVKLDAALAFAKAAGIKPDNSGNDPYSDVPSADWGIVHALTENYSFTYQGTNFNMNAPMFTADSSTQFGSDLTAAQIDRAVQIASGMQPGHDAYLPGGSVVGFGNAIGLNKGISTSGNLSESDVMTMMNSYATIKKGYIALGGDKFQIVWTPTPDPNYWETSIPASTYAQDWANAISVVDKSVTTYSSGAFTTQVPAYSDAGYNSTSGNYIELTGISPQEQYSINGGAWKTATAAFGYDSLDPSSGGQSATPSSVKIKDSNGGGLSVNYVYNGNDQSFAAAGVLYQNGNFAGSSEQ